MSLATPTAQELIEKAYDMIGANNPETSDLNIGLDALNDLMDTWSNMKRMVTVNTIESVTLTIGTREYTIGSGGDFNTARPIKIRSAFIRAAGTNTDTPITVYTKGEYNAQVDKTVTGRPWIMVYLNEFPLGKIILNRTPNAADALHLDTWKPLSDIATLATTLSFPPGYRAAFRYNLAVQLADNTTQTINPRIVNRAEKAKRRIKAINSTPIPRATFHRELTRQKPFNRFDIRAGTHV